MNNLKIEHIILTSGEEAVTLNNRLILSADPGYGENVSQIRKVAERLERVLGYISEEVKMEAPHGHMLDWDNVLASRAAVQDLSVDDARAALTAHGITVTESDNGYCFTFDTSATGLPPTDTGECDAGIAISSDFDTEKEAIMAAYQWGMSVQIYQEKAVTYQASQGQGVGPAP